MIFAILEFAIGVFNLVMGIIQWPWPVGVAGYFLVPAWRLGFASQSG